MTEEREATCPHCGHRVLYRRYHAGFGDQGYMYCDRDETVLVWSSYDPVHARLSGSRHPWMLDEEGRRRVEEAVRPCPYGGTFRFSNPPRCPHCGGDLSELVPDRIYYIVTGRIVSGEEGDPVWRPEAISAAEGGGRGA